MSGMDERPFDRPSGTGWVVSRARRYGRDVPAGAAVAAYGLWEGLRGGSESTFHFGPGLVVTLLTAAAVGAVRTRPRAALLLAWLSPVVVVTEHMELLQVQLGVAFVAYGTARWGDTAELWLGGLSVLLGVPAATALIYHDGVDATGSAALAFRIQYASERALGYDSNRALLALFGCMLFILLAGPWAVGLVQRVRQRAARDTARAEARRIHAEVEWAQTQRVAELRESQAKMARDVHDVVGHSLAVILAQAESARFLPEADTAAMGRAMRNIADSARRSLHDVREVLAAGGDEQRGEVLPAGGMDELVDGIRSAGNTVCSTVDGVPRPLPAELDVTAFRVLQEMLTNALKHGVRGEPVVVVRSWGADLLLMVSNVTAEPVTAAGEHRGLGIDGMRRRLAAAGGRLAVGRDRDAMERPRFTATAWLPLERRS